MSSRASLNHVYRTVWNESIGAMVAVAEIDSGRGQSGGARVGTSDPSPWCGVIHLSALALGVALAWGSVTGNALANPTGGIAVAGQATMATTGNQLLVTTQNGVGTNHSAINWQSFSIPNGNTTHFQQPNAASTLINRVVTNTPSAIFGTLSSNGHVVLVNQAGIAVGTGAVVDTAGFTASSLRMSDADALTGRLRFGDGTDATSGVAVQGRILARSGDVVLLGANVETAHGAVIQAPNGSTMLAAGQQVEITGRGLEGIRLQVQAPTDRAVNLGTLEGEAVGIFAGTLRHSGLIQATRATLEGGQVVLKASGDAFVEGAGKIVAGGATGGSVDVLGKRVAVTDQAQIDVSGSQGGGTVRVGGDYQGKNPDVQNAEFVYFGPQASIKADASDNGNGGRVILWADDTTRAHGSISAQGGTHGGDGGFVETSGKQALSTAGARVDTRADVGATGQWLLDPNSIDIVATGPSVDVSGSIDFTSTGAGKLYVSDLVSALNSNNVTVTADSNLSVSAPISSNGSNSLSLESTSGNITLGASVTLGSGGNLGFLKLKSGGTISQTSGTITSASVEIDAGGAVSLNGANDLNELKIVNAGAVTVTNNGALNIKSISAGSFSLKANGDITQFEGPITTSNGGIDIAATAGMISSGEGISATGGTVKLSATSGMFLSGFGGVSSNAAGNAVIFITSGGQLYVETMVTTSGSGGRWLAYVPTVASSNFPSGMAFKQYNATVGSTVLGTGNGVLVAQAPVLTLSSNTLSGSVSKVYDGGTGIDIFGYTLPTVSGGGIDGDDISGAVLSGGSGNLDNRHVGDGKTVTANGVTVTGILSGAMPVYGYSLPTISGNIGTVTQRPTAVWTGGSNSSSWSSAGNWDALPDGGNVASVLIPAGVGPIVFDAAVGTTSLKALTSGSPVLVTGGGLQVSDSLNVAGFAQTGGTVSGGTLKVVGPFNQTGGSIDMSAIDVMTPAGDIVFSNLKAPTIALRAPAGSISQLGGVTTAFLTTGSSSGTVLNSSGNRIGSFVASNSGSGSVELTNVGAISELDIQNAGGDVVVVNTGGISTRVVSASGAASITANSPLTVGAGGISAGGNIVLTASNQTSSGDMTLNGSVNSSGGSVALNAANSLLQNGSVYGAAGVTATVGGALVIGPGATTGASPVSYTVGGLAVTPPPTGVPNTPVVPVVPIDPLTPTPPLEPPKPIEDIQVTNAVVQTNLVTTFLDKFEVALLDQADDKSENKNSASDLVLEGEVCRP